MERGSTRRQAMSMEIIKIEIRYEQDIVLARQRARTIAGLLGFNNNDQTRISAAVSEISRNAFKYAGGGEVDFLVEEKEKPQTFTIRITDKGPGIEDVDAILEGSFKSRTGWGIGITGAKRLMDYFHIESVPDKGATVSLGMTIPKYAPVVTARTLLDISEQLAAQVPQNPFEEMQQQNQELLRAMNELKQRQEELERLNHELEDTNRGIIALYAELDEKALYLSRANKLKSHFLSNMSHEFKTPLNSILSLSRLLSDRVDGDLTQEQEKQVVYIRKAAEDLSTLVNDLLDLAKIEAGKIVVHPAEFEISNTFGALRGMLKPLLINPAVNFVIEKPEGIPPMFTDEGKLSQILRNFISNAIKFTEKGEIRVSAKLAKDVKEVVFSVADTGIGIPAEYHEKIFDEFTQVETPLQKKVKGTGLGLPLSRKLTELLGGRLKVESAVGTGSVFYATIPVVYSETAKEEIKTAAVAVTSSIEKVLVIDDEEVARYIFKGLLAADAKYTILEASNGKDGIRIAEEEQPGIIFLDILMPEMDGFEVLTRLKASSKTRNIPVIIVTAKALEKDELAALRKNAVAVLSKESTSREAAISKIRDAIAKIAEGKNRRETDDG